MEELVEKIEFYLQEEADNPNRDVLLQAPILLVQEYRDLGKKEGKYRQKAQKILQKFKDSYFDSLPLLYKRNFIIVDIQSDPSKSLEKSLEYVKETPCVDSNVLAYFESGEEKYIEEAYRLYQAGEYGGIDSVTNLANAFFNNKQDDLKYFEIIYSVTSDYSDIQMLRRLISVGINLGKVQQVKEILEENKKIQGLSDDYIYFSSIIENKRGNIQEALDIINGYSLSEENPQILYLKSHLEYRLGNKNYVNSIFKLHDIYHESGFGNVAAEDKIKFLNSFATIDLRKSIEIIYECLQETHAEEHEKEFKRLFFSFILSSEKKELYFDTDSIEKDSVVTLRNVKNGDIYTIIGDGISSKEYGFKRIFSEDEFSRFLGGEVGHKFEDIFGNILGITQEYEVTLIESKYLHMYRKLFNTGLEDTIGGIKISTPVINGKTDFTEFREMNRVISEQNKQKDIHLKENFEEKGILSFGVVQHYTGYNYFEIYFQSKYQVKHSDLKCDMKESGCIKNIVLDPSSIISIQELQIDHIMPDTFNLFIAHSTLSYFQNLLEVKKNTPDSMMSIGTREDGGMYKIEYTPEYHRSYLEKLEKIVEWILKNTQMLASDTLALDDREYDQVFGREFNDALTIAQEYKYELYSDDHVLRLFARETENAIKAFGSEQLLNYLQKENAIYPELLCDSYLKLIDLGFQDITISSGIIHYFIIKQKTQELEQMVHFVATVYQDKDFLVGIIIDSILSFDSLLGARVPIHHYYSFKHDYIRILVHSYITVLEKNYTKEEVSGKLQELLEQEDSKNCTLVKAILNL